MADAQLVAQISTKGAKKAEQELKLVGQQAKKTENNVIQMGDSFKSVSKNASAASAAITGPLGGVASRITAITTLLTSGAAAATLFGTALAGVGFALTNGVQVLDEYNVGLAKTEAILKATGDASGKTSLQLQEQARSIALATLASTQGIQEAQSRLLTFDRIQGKVFDDAISLAQDLATVFGGTAASQATQLGKALQDPIKGLTALNRVGVSFSKQQEDQVRSLVASGDAMKAQAVIIEALKKQVGGAGESVAKDSLAGKVDTIGQKWDELTAKFAKSSGAFSATERLLDGVIGRLGEWQGAITDTSDPVEELIVQIGDLQARIEGAEAALINEDGKLAVRQKTRLAYIKDLKQQEQDLRDEIIEISKGIDGQREREFNAYAAREAKKVQIAKEAAEEQARIEEENRVKLQSIREQEGAQARIEAEKRQAERIAEANDIVKTRIQVANAQKAIDKSISDEASRAQSEQIGALDDTTSKLKILLGEQNTAYKASAILNATITTYESANKAFNALAGIPVIGPALGGAAAGVAIASGLANVRQISSARRQGGNLAPGQTSTIAEDNKLEIITPSSASRVRTAQQMQQIMGESGGSNNWNVTVINQGTNTEVQTEQDDKGELIILINDTVAAGFQNPNSKIGKSAKPFVQQTARG